ncbi:MAG: hypothetical protein GXO47_07830 [Chlorobi bacterium]|nr:hypothetical protein [Chlorobiota bacterium]
MLPVKFQYILFLVTLVAAGCSSYSELNYEILRPAKYSVPPEIKTVVLVDNSVVFPDTNVNVIRVGDEIVKVDTTKVQDYTKFVLNTVWEELGNRHFFDTVFIDSIHYKMISKRGPVEKLSQKQIAEICNKFGVDAIVSLDAYRYTNNIKVNDMGDYEYYSTYDASAIHLWRIYDCHSGNIMNVHLQKDTIFWEGYGNSLNQSLAGFPSFSDATHAIGSYLAYKYVDYVAPHWEEVTRRLYTSGNMNFLNATEWLNKGNWVEAEKIWNYIYRNGPEKARIKAALNLAVAFERKGNIKQAYEWAHKAYSILAEKEGSDNSGFKRYIIDLYTQMAVRMNEIKKLEEQLGPAE